MKQFLGIAAVVFFSVIITIGCGKSKTAADDNRQTKGRYSETEYFTMVNAAVIIQIIPIVIIKQSKLFYNLQWLMPQETKNSPIFFSKRYSQMRCEPKLDYIVYTSGIKQKKTGTTQINLILTKLKRGQK